MSVRGAVLGCFAALVLVSGARASDAVVDDQPRLGSEPVKACDAYGTGFVAVPGTGTCVRVSGQLRYEERFSSTGHNSRGRSSMDFETRSDAW